MPPNTDDTATLGADPHNPSAGAPASLEEDFHLIDDPPEHEAGRDKLEAAGDREQGAESPAPQSADKPVREGDETPGTDIAERDKAARLRGAADSAAGALRRGAAGIGKAAGALGDGMAGSARAVGGRASDVSARTGRFAADSLREGPGATPAPTSDINGSERRKCPPRDQCRSEPGPVDANHIRVRPSHRL